MWHVLLGLVAQAEVVGFGHGLAMVGAGLVVIGAGLGIGRIGASMAEGMARQPEAGGSIQIASLILAALIEGAALFGLVIALLIGFVKS